MKLFTTPFEGLNDLIIGFPSDTPIGIMAPAGEGKSILVTQFGMDFAKQLGGNVLVIKTEKLNSMLHEMWADKFNKSKYTDKPVELFIERARNIDELMKLNGYDMEIQLSSSGEGKKAKKVLILKGVNIDKCKVRKYIAEKNVKVVIYDSLTTPFNAVLTGGQQNTPCRHEVEEMFFQSLQMLFSGTDCAIITTNHITFNPQKPFMTREQYDIKGGKSIKHNTDYLLYLEQGKSRYTLNQRTVYIARHPILREWSDSVVLWLDNDGYRELSEEELKALKAKMKAEIKGEVEEEAETPQPEVPKPAN